MSYAGISVQEAMGRLNNLNGGWYLPYIQRQYVWGARYESEEYVCLLLDSLMKGYPIGGLVLWETTKPVPYREFFNDYEPGKFAKQVEEGRRGAYKFLVYDGQQRLQTLRSVLYYTFNGRALHFDLFFDSDNAPPEETGFLFRHKDKAAEPRYLKLTQLVSTPCDEREKVKLEYRLLEELRRDRPIDIETELQIRRNLSALWNVFVTTNEKSIAYFPVNADDEKTVNEVFRRLNTGGIVLTEVEQVLGEIKKHEPSYEETLWKLSEEIRSRSNGIEVSSAQVLQFFHLLEKGTTRIYAANLGPGDAEKILAASTHRETLIELFESYLWGLFKINNARIVPRWLSVLPLAIYLTALKKAGWEWRVKALSAEQVSAMHTYFLLSQFCDWNTQTMVNNFAELAARAGSDGEMLPIEGFRRVAVEKNRTGLFSSQQFLAAPWFALKVLTSGRVYVFHDNKPQLDHIFPRHLSGADPNYQDAVDVLWNLQPIPDGINNFKRARNPKEFFNSSDGFKYLEEYDFIPERDSSIWDDPFRFVQYREGEMRRALRSRYGLEIESAYSRVDAH